MNIKKTMREPERMYNETTMPGDPSFQELSMSEQEYWFNEASASSDYDDEDY